MIASPNIVGTLTSIVYLDKLLQNLIEHKVSGYGCMLYMLRENLSQTLFRLWTPCVWLLHKKLPILP
jgi:hypothetical protein